LTGRIYSRSLKIRRGPVSEGEVEPRFPVEVRTGIPARKPRAHLIDNTGNPFGENPTKTQNALRAFPDKRETGTASGRLLSTILFAAPCRASEAAFRAKAGQWVFQALRWMRDGARCGPSP
jgi:hypothetical protein